MVINKSNKDRCSPGNWAIVGGTVWGCSSMTLRAHDVIIVFYFQVWRPFLNRGLFYFSYFHLPGSSICCPVHPLGIHPLLCTWWSRPSWRRHPPESSASRGWAATYWLHSLLAEWGKHLMKHHGSVPGCSSLGSGNQRGQPGQMTFYLFRGNKISFSIVTL